MRTIQISDEDSKFLEDLQHELNTQTNDGNADPVYWGVMETREVGVPDGCGDERIYLGDGGTETLEGAVAYIAEYIVDDEDMEAWNEVDKTNIDDVVEFCREKLGNDRILMEIYMDKAYIAYADLHEVAEALRNCEFATDNMKGQADALDKIYKDYPDAFGVLINATSVNCAEDFMDCDIDEDGEITDRRLKEDSYDAIQYLRDMKRFDWDLDKYLEWYNKKNKED